MSGLRASGSKPFRFGVNTWAASSSREWIDKALRIEALGYSTLFMPDHLADTLSPFSALAVGAQAAPTLRVGPFVLNNDLRHPVVVAHEVATLDLLTGGRVELGLGAGYADAEYRQAGLRSKAGVFGWPALRNRCRSSRGSLVVRPFPSLATTTRSRAIGSRRRQYSGHGHRF